MLKLSLDYFQYHNCLILEKYQIVFVWLTLIGPFSGFNRSIIVGVDHPQKAKTDNQKIEEKWQTTLYWANIRILD